MYITFCPYFHSSQLKCYTQPYCLLTIASTCVCAALLMSVIETSSHSWCGRKVSHYWPWELTKETYLYTTTDLHGSLSLMLLLLLSGSDLGVWTQLHKFGVPTFPQYIAEHPQKGATKQRKVKENGSKCHSCSPTLDQTDIYEQYYSWRIKAYTTTSFSPTSCSIYITPVYLKGGV